MDVPPPVTSPLVAAQDTPGLKWCPDCHHAMRRYRVTFSDPFALDHCYHCGGVWLDQDEWEALEARGLHVDLYHVFTDSFQAHLQQTERRRLTEEQFRRQLGDETFARALEIKTWLEHHPHRSQLFAYLQWDPARD